MSVPQATVLFWNSHYGLRWCQESTSECRQMQWSVGLRLSVAQATTRRWLSVSGHCEASKLVPCFARECELWTTHIFSTHRGASPGWFRPRPPSLDSIQRDAVVEGFPSKRSRSPLPGSFPLCCKQFIARELASNRTGDHYESSERFCYRL